MNFSMLWRNRVTSIVLGSIQWKFVATVVTVAVIAIVALTALNIQESQSNSKAAAAAGLGSGSELQAKTIESSLTQLAGDIRTLAFTPPPAAIQRALANGGVDPKSGDSAEIWKNRLATIFSAMMSSKGVYMQIRMLDASGQEIVRIDEVDGTPVRRGDETLQDKSGSGYFTAPASLSSGAVFVTSLSLNREGGKIQVPHTPVVRFATPIVGADGALGGVIVTNVFADRFLARLVGQKGQAILVTDGDGQLLLAPDDSMTFGLELESGTTLASLHGPTTAAELMTGTGVLSVDDQLAGQGTEMVQRTVDGTVRAMEEGAEEMDAGTAAAAEAQEALGEIRSSVRTVKQQIDSIASGADKLKDSSGEMVNVVSEVKDIATSASESVTSIASIAQENAAGSEEVSAAAEEMTAQVDEVSAASVELGRMADDLREQVSAFRLGEQAQEPTPMRSAADADQEDREAA